LRSPTPRTEATAAESRALLPIRPMRVGFFGQSGPFAPPALRYLLSHGGDFALVLVVEGRKSKPGRMEHRLRQPKVGRLPEGTSLAELARAAGIPALETCDVNAAVALETISRFALDWIVCVGFDRLFAPALLALAKRGALNAHPSLLPRWRGPSPLFWQVRTGDRSFGVTIHAIDEREDHGCIYAQAPFAAPHAASGDELYRLAAQVAAPLLLEVLARAAARALSGIPQDDAGACRARRPRAEDVLIEPATWGCRHLVDFCCAAPFFRTPWIRFGEEVFFIRRGVAAEPGRHMPGQYGLAGATLIVRCKDGLAHLEIQV
jgi:methionyl-tRNA formyltransferase